MITVIANLKGGSGKSTVTFNLGLWLQMKGQPVVAYDLDPQQTLADVAEVRREEGYTPPLQVNLPRDSFLNDIQYHPQQTQVLVDVGASNMQAMKEALSIANRIIIPVPPSQPDVWATQRFLNIVAEACTNTKPEMRVFVNRADTHHAITESDETEEVLKQLANVSLITQRLYQRTLYRRSLSEGMSIFELSRRCKASNEFNRFASILYPELSD
ncbi:MAG: AAA family ATPase [Gammaproteobacteria bacterium]|nr:AAA family ATPase [Gammaproteobacteria bacterium]